MAPRAARPWREGDAVALLRRKPLRARVCVPRLTWRVIALSAAASLSGPAASEEQRLVWQMNSLLHPRLFGEAGAHFAQAVERLSGGSLGIELHDRLVLDQDTFAALDSGLIDAIWGSAGHHHSEDPALTIFRVFPSVPIRRDLPLGCRPVAVPR